MAALGSILRKGANNPSAHRTTQYEKLAQDPSDNEEEDDVLFRQGNGIEVAGVTRLQNGISRNSHATSNGNQESIEMDSMPTIHTARKLGSDVKVHLVRTGLLTRTRIACFIMVLLSGISIAFGFAFILPYFTGKGGRSSVHIYHRSAPWTHILPELGTESEVWLVDVDGDGKKDVLFGTMKEFGFRVSSTDMMQSLCKQKNLPFPCVGMVLALRGTDGAELWHLMTYSGVENIKCDVIDINGDGRKDCIATGRMGTMVAFDTRNGTVLWHGDSSVLNPAWNVYAPVILPDLDLDGVPEIVIAHGGDDAFPHAKLVAHKLASRMSAGRLVMLSGKTGKSLGRVFEMARMRQTYMPPIMHTTSDGSAYILFGTGEASVPGSLFMISVPDLYRYVRQWNKTTEVPNINGTYKTWPNLMCDGHGLCEIFSSSMKGLMVPPVCVDLTGDGIRDIVMAAYDGTVMVRHGETMKEVWKVAFAGYEAHSAPAPAYFNNDDTLDLMLHLNHGTWPRFNHSKAIILDGKTGQTLWSLKTFQHEMTSDLVIRTTNPHRDAYVFRVQGRHGKKPFGTASRRRRAATDAEKAYVPKQRQNDYDYRDYGDYDSKPDYRYQYLPTGNTYNPYRQRYGPQQGRDEEGYGTQRGSDLQRLWPSSDQDRPRTIFDGVQETDSLYPGGEDIAFGNPIGESDPLDSLGTQGRKNMAPSDHVQGKDQLPVPPPATAAPYVSLCERNLNEFNTEVFIMDRTLMNSPLKVTEIPATKLHYNLTANDKKMLESIRSAGSSRVRRAVRQTRPLGQGLAQGQNLSPARDQGLAQSQPLGQGQGQTPRLPLGQSQGQTPLHRQANAPRYTSSQRRLPPSAPGHTRVGGVLGQPQPSQSHKEGHQPDRTAQGVPPQGGTTHTKKQPPVKTEPDVELCTVMLASEMVTGTIGDVDGDGSLDLLLMFDREAPIRAADGTYIRSEYVTEVTKVNLVEVLARKELVPMNVTIPHPDIMKSEGEKSFFKIQFRTVDKQPWMSYLGTYGDSIYRT